MSAYKLFAIAALFLLPFSGFAQKIQARQILSGKVIADSLAVDNLNVNNLTSHIGAVTDANGVFTLYARPTDTLLFSSVTFHSVQLVLKEEDFSEAQLIIKLNVHVTVLDEVVITPNVLSGNLAADSKKTKTLTVISGMDLKDTYTEIKYAPNEYKYGSTDNGALPKSESPLKGIDVARIYRLYIKKNKKTKKDRGEIYSAEGQKTFPEAVKEKFTYNFFTEALKIPRDEIGLFLNFCDKGAETAPLLDPKKEFELTDYLVQKGSEYLQLKK